MQMVKGGNQTNFIGAQHAVPENVASHIADTHRGDFVLLNVNTPFAKMPLHRNPCAARGNAHAFVVIPLAATGRHGHYRGWRLDRLEEYASELLSRGHLVCWLLL